MCSVDAPKAVETDDPVFVRNPFLDEAAQDTETAGALRRGRSSLVISRNNSLGTSGRGGNTVAADTPNPNGNFANGAGGAGNGNYTSRPLGPDTSKMFNKGTGGNK